MSVALVEEEATVRAFGRSLPRATRGERFAWGVCLAGVLAVLAVASQLRPDPRGVGTHEQIPLIGGKMLPCGFYAFTKERWGVGYPCPSCGFTTTFAYSMHGRLVEAVKNQPFGFCVFLGFVSAVPVSLLALVKGISPVRSTDHWPWKWILILTAVGWLLGWIYKVRMLTP